MAGRVADTTGRLAKVHELPDPATGGDGLTARQRLVLETIRASVEQRGYPPSMREIGEAVGLTSPSSVKHQLTTLERKGYLRRDPNRPRAIEVVQTDDSRGIRALPGSGFPRVEGVDPAEDSPERPTPSYVPVVHRGRWPHPRRAGRRGRVPAAPSARGRR